MSNKMVESEARTYSKHYSITVMWNELCISDSVSVVCKTFLIYTLNTSNVIVVSFNLNCKLHAVFVGKLTERCQILGQFGFN